MSLSTGITIARRGPPRNGEFGYPVAPGEKVFSGGAVGLNAAGQMVRPQTSGCVVLIGIADRTLDNSASAVASDERVVAMRGTFALAVTGGTASKITAAVYASDDNTFTVTNSGSLLAVGTLAGIEGSQTYVQI